MITTIAAVVTFLFTTALTIAGVGAAFILIPVFDAMGIPLREAMSTALLLNCIAMIFASIRYQRKGLIVFRTAIPILVVATALSPVGALTAQYVPEVPLRWLFVAFLLFAAVMMVIYHPAQHVGAGGAGMKTLLLHGVWVGGLAGFVGGLLGVGGGNIIVPVLIWLGFEAKKASATTAFIVVFSSFSGFLGHSTVGDMNWWLLGSAALGSIGGAILGAYLMTDKLKKSQVKTVIGVILFAIAVKMIWKLVV